MPYTTTGKNLMLNALKGTNPATPITHAGLYDDNDDELTGGSPAYARKAISFANADGGAIDSSSTPEFDVPAGTTVKGVSFHSALTDGVTLATRDLAAPEVFGAQGTLTLTDADLDLNA